MTIRRMMTCAAASVFLWAGAAAQNEGRQWKAVDNETLYGQMLDFMTGFQEETAGEQAFYIMQDALMRIKAVHALKPYEWISQTADLCLVLEAIYPPCVSHPVEGDDDRMERIRRGILRLWDYPVHVCSSKNADDAITPPSEQADKFSDMIIKHIQVKRDCLFDCLSRPRPSGGELQLIKAYSSGFVLRTKNACVAFDICYNYGFASVERIDELVSCLDAVCFTHAHQDHFDYTLASKMLEAGKPVIMPSDLVVGVSSPKKYVWKDGMADLTGISEGFSASAVMSAQGTEPCLVYYVDVDGWRIAHNGDNSIVGNLGFLSGKEQPDVIFLDFFGNFTDHMRHYVNMPCTRNIAPVYVTTHGNEYHHTVYRRIGYHYLYYAYTAFGNRSFPYPDYAGMDNGEMIVLKK